MTFRIPLTLLLLCLVKKLTVNGIIGKTQGVSNAAKPEIKAIKKIDHKLLAGFGAGTSPLVSPASTNPDVTKVGDYIFRVCFIDPFQGLVGAKFARENLKIKKAAVLRDVKNDYSVGLADVFVTEFKKMGGEIVGDVSYQSGDIDFKAQLYLHATPTGETYIQLHIHMTLANKVVGWCHFFTMNTGPASDANMEP